MNTYDVIVIGAGPAGSMTASTIASKGYSVQLIEKKKEIGNPVQCAEVMTNFCLENVNLKTDKRWIKHKVDGIKFVLPEKSCFYSHIPALCIDRGEFDKWLVQKAVEHGVDVHTSTSFRSLDGKPGDWIVSTLKDNSKGKIIIGADGPSSLVAKQLGLLKQTNYFRGYQYKFDSSDVDYPEHNFLCMYLDEKFCGGYGWVFPRGDEFNIGVGGHGISIDILDAFVSSLNIKKEKKKQMNSGLIPFNFIFKSRADDGVMIVGDAAGMTNPATGAGIHAALFSGKLAGEIAIKALSSKDISLTNLYGASIQKSSFLHPSYYKTAIYFQNWSNEDWSSLGNVVNGVDFSTLTLWKSFLLGLHHPRFFLKSRQMLTIRKAMKMNEKYGW